MATLVHTLNPTLGTKVELDEREDVARVWSPSLGWREVVPAEAIVKLAIHRPDVFDHWRKP